MAGIMASHGVEEQLEHRSLRRQLAYTTHSTAQDCKSCIGNGSKEWCKYRTSTSYGYCCDLTHSSSYCGDSSSYLCSSDSSKFPQNAKEILCPKDYSSCGDQDQSLTSSTRSKTFTSNSISTSTICWYEVYASSSYISQITISAETLTSATLEIYGEGSSNSLVYKGSQGKESKTYSVGSYDNLYVLVRPTSSGAKVKFTATSNYNSSSYSSSGVSSTGTTLIIVFSVLGGVAFIALFVVIAIIKRVRLNKQRAAMVGNGAAAQQINLAQPSPPQNHTQNYPQPYAMNQNDATQQNVYHSQQQPAMYPRKSFPILTPLI